VKLLGVIALVFWAIHAGNHVFFRHTAHDLFWVCNVAPVVLAVGCFRRSARVCAVATAWLSYGMPIWLLDLATGANMIRTSVFTHFGCLGIGFIAAKQLGWPRRTWAVATLASLVPLLLARLFTPPEPNVMLAFRVHDGWEKYFSSHPVYVAVMLAGSAVVFLIVETIVRRVLGLSSAPS
jgi:hypothetical protein